MNPTGGIRRAARRVYKTLDENKVKPSYGKLTAAQWNLHPGSYGEYWNFWSSQNPNFSRLCLLWNRRHHAAQRAPAL